MQVRIENAYSSAPLRGRAYALCNFARFSGLLPRPHGTGRPAVPFRRPPAGRFSCECKPIGFRMIHLASTISDAAPCGSPAVSPDTHSAPPAAVRTALRCARRPSVRRVFRNEESAGAAGLDARRPLPAKSDFSKCTEPLRCPRGCSGRRPEPHGCRAPRLIPRPHTIRCRGFSSAVPRSCAPRGVRPSGSAFLSSFFLSF